MLVEDPLFFTQYRFHAQKLVLHRASMTEFAQQCERLGKQVHRIDSKSISHSSEIGEILRKKKITQAVIVEPSDVWLRERVVAGCEKSGIGLEWFDDPSFLTPIDVMQQWAEHKQHYRFTDFYMQQRKSGRSFGDGHRGFHRAIHPGGNVLNGDKLIQLQIR